MYIHTSISIYVCIHVSPPAFPAGWSGPVGRVGGDSATCAIVIICYSIV